MENNLQNPSAVNYSVMVHVPHPGGSGGPCLVQRREIHSLHSGDGFYSFDLPVGIRNSAEVLIFERDSGVRTGRGANLPRWVCAQPQAGNDGPLKVVDKGIYKENEGFLDSLQGRWHSFKITLREPETAKATFQLKDRDGNVHAAKRFIFRPWEPKRFTLISDFHDLVTGVRETTWRVREPDGREYTHTIFLD